MLEKLRSKKGFTLMEMLIVVAIIAILIAIAIPTFAAQLDKANQATDAANIRSAYAEAALNALENGTGTGSAESVPMVHTGTFNKLTNARIGNTDITTKSVTKGNTVTVTVNADGSVAVDPN